ncbi:MAG TPA: hypothetical protein VF730_13415 [Terracidiphilus sp.]
MHKRDGAAVRFIQAFARNSAEGNFVELVAQFAESFLFAGTQGSQWVRASDFAMALPKRKQIFAGFGHKSTELADAQEKWLDTRYALVRTRWRFSFDRGQNGPETLETESSFVVDAGAEPFRILVYMPHHDIVEMLRQSA